MPSLNCNVEIEGGEVGTLNCRIPAGMSRTTCFFDGMREENSLRCEYKVAGGYAKLIAIHTNGYVRAKVCKLKTFMGSFAHVSYCYPMKRMHLITRFYGSLLYGIYYRQ